MRGVGDEGALRVAPSSEAHRQQVVQRADERRHFIRHAPAIGKRIERFGRTRLSDCLRDTQRRRPRLTSSQK